MDRFFSDDDYRDKIIMMVECDICKSLEEDCGCWECSVCEIIFKESEEPADHFRTGYICWSCYEEDD